MSTSRISRLSRFPALTAVLAAVVALTGFLAVGGAGTARGDVPPAPGWTLQWSDDFTGPDRSLPSSADWQIDTGHGYPGGPGNWGTGEIQNYTSSPDNLSLDGNGNLRITPLRDGAGNWTSARIETRRADFKAPAGGTLRIEGRIQMPNVTGDAALGYWPAFWALGAPYRGNYWNWPGIGEFDIMENVNGINSVWGVLHCGVNPGGPCNETTGLGASRTCPGASCQSAFHTYRFEWDRSASPNALRWYVDDQLFHSVDQNRVDAGTWANMTEHAGYFLLLNVAIGGAFPDALAGKTPTAATVPGRPMLVDYVGVWTRGGSTTPPDPTDPPPSGSSQLYLRGSGAAGDATGAGSTVALASAGGANHDGSPHSPQVFTSGPITRAYNGGSTQFDLFVDAGTTVANGQQVRVSYDRTGDGTWDRTETYHYFATDPAPGYEHYTQARGLQSATGTHGNLTNGKVRIEVWNAIGNGASTLGIGNQSVVRIPFG
ncbi:glycoside hydrolase family 16 protein [Streptomyces sp. NBC_01619]|uniref:Glycoside hydrolase family 16 protein n=1 Tax=Streptomyces pratisoli TaxID=3139917 RepID=A0ACC6QNJ5_9ACTN|nr:MULTISPECIES: glycoside hydrolase family 16 protein [unclassified Streptomyces]MCX4513389.1 glycoside hydrolase family 16 protein [Streptomyces sp. NBC_01619]